MENSGLLQNLQIWIREIRNFQTEIRVKQNYCLKMSFVYRKPQ